MFCLQLYCSCCPQICKSVCNFVALRQLVQKHHGHFPGPSKDRQLEPYKSRKTFVPDMFSILVSHVLNQDKVSSWIDIGD